MGITTHVQFTRLNALTKSMLKTVENRQAEYFAKHQQYFQGLKMPIIGKLDGDILGDINPGLKPQDQEASWAEFGPTDFKPGGKLPVHISINVYDAPIGMGWILKLELFADLGPDTYGNEGNHWVWKHNEGPASIGGIWDDWYIEPAEEQ